MKSTVCIIGHFGGDKVYLDGQTIKTKIIAEELKKCLGENEVRAIDTHGGIKTLIKAPFQAISALSFSQNIIMLPAHNGLRIFGRLLPFLKRFFKGRKIHYVVIGGWLSPFCRKENSLQSV